MLLLSCILNELTQQKNDVVHWTIMNIGTRALDLNKFSRNKTYTFIDLPLNYKIHCKLIKFTRFCPNDHHNYWVIVMLIKLDENGDSSNHHRIYWINHCVSGFWLGTHFIIMKNNIWFKYGHTFNRWYWAIIQSLRLHLQKYCMTIWQKITFAVPILKMYKIHLPQLLLPMWGCLKCYVLIIKTLTYV